MESIEILVTRAQAPDDALVRRQEAFGELVKRTQDLAYGYAYALLGDAQLAQDAAQEGFLTAYRQLDQLRDPSAFPGWLRRIVRTHCLRQRRRRRLATAPIEAGLHVPATDADPVTVAERREVREVVAAMVRALPDHERIVTVLFYVGGYTQQDIARFLGVPVTTIKKRLQSSRKRLQERMLTMEDDTLREHALPRWPRRSLSGMLTVVGDTLRERAPSRDDRFADTVQFLAALDAAAAEGELHLAELLLIDGFDVNAPDRHGRTLLSWAAQRGHLDTVEFLLEHGAEVNPR
ncbi:MAG: sigma-70 family RNA polymerase sigma factor, partial [Chloroflexota bacterium]